MRRLWTVAAMMVAVSFLGLSFLRADDAPAKKEHKRPPIEQIFKKLDANGNGTISAEELAKSPRVKTIEKAKEIVGRWDANKDGKVSIKEFTAALTRMHAHRGEHRGEHAEHHGEHHGEHHAKKAPPKKECPAKK